jgi:hypothetical protein
MTDIALPLAGEPGPSRLASAIRGTGAAIVSTYRLGGRMWLAAPAILAIAVVPEMAQHAAEIHVGMFDSRAGAIAAEHDPLRWTFAYPKIAGFVIAILATARFLSLGSVRRALLIGPGNLARLALAIALTLLVELPADWLKERSASGLVDGLATAALIVAQAGLLVYVVGALIDDRTNSLRRSFTERWPTALLLTLLAALAFVPAQALHMYNHMLAIGQHPAIVWALMVFDSLVVGLIAALVGAALHVSYRAGPTWSGWTERPRLG